MTHKQLVNLVADGICKETKEHKVCSKCCYDCYNKVEHSVTDYEIEIRADERAKVLKAVIDCGWHCEVHSDRALYEMVEIELKEVQNDT